MPTPAEIAAQARISRRFIAAHKQGACACEARHVEGGIAYRLYGSPENTTWQWMRTADFDAAYDTFDFVDTGEILQSLQQAYRDVSQWKRFSMACQKSMGKNSRRRMEALVSKP